MLYLQLHSIVRANTYLVHNWRTKLNTCFPWQLRLVKTLTLKSYQASIQLKKYLLSWLQLKKYLISWLPLFYKLNKIIYPWDARKMKEKQGNGVHLIRIILYLFLSRQRSRSEGPSAADFLLGLEHASGTIEMQIDKDF